jgi:hypothetical protein
MPNSVGADLVCPTHWLPTHRSSMSTDSSFTMGGPHSCRSITVPGAVRSSPNQSATGGLMNSNGKALIPQEKFLKCTRLTNGGVACYQ